MGWRAATNRDHCVNIEIVRNREFGLSSRVVEAFHSMRYQLAAGGLDRQILPCRACIEGVCDGGLIVIFETRSRGDHYQDGGILCPHAVCRYEQVEELRKLIRILAL